MNLTDYRRFKKGRMLFELQPCRAVFVFLCLLVFLVIATLVLSMLLPFDDIVKAGVFIRPNDNISSVRSTVSGEITEILYVNNQHVEEGALLLKFDTAADELELKNAQVKLQSVEKGIAEDALLMVAMRTGRLSEEDLQDEENAKAAAALFEMIRRQNEVEESRLSLTREQQRPAMLTTAHRIEELRNAYERQVANYQSWFNERIASVSQEIQDLQMEHDGIERQVLDLEHHIRDSNLRAPIPGVVKTTRTINRGDNVFAGEELLCIVPRAALKAMVQIKPEDIARVKAGLDVQIRFPGLPPSRFGQVAARISLVPPDYTLLPSGNPMFVAEAYIDEPYLYSKGGEKVALVPGLFAEGRIVVDHTSAFNMFLKRLDFAI